MTDSEDFDKEAEREKLREQFESDREKREATERMSDLLLKGATMTNRHCPECDSPIFRNEDQHFCPTCQRPVQTREAEADQQTRPDDRARAEGEPSTEAADATPESGDEPGDERPRDPSERTSVDEAALDAEPAVRRPDPSEVVERTDGEPSSRTDATRREASSRTDATRREASSPGRTTPDVSDASSTSPPSDAGDLGAAEASLARTLTALARRAEETGDVGRQREYLEAAREAAEALAATRRARR